MLLDAAFDEVPEARQLILVEALCQFADSPPGAAADHDVVGLFDGRVHERFDGVFVRLHEPRDLPAPHKIDQGFGRMEPQTLVRQLDLLEGARLDADVLSQLVTRQAQGLAQLADTVTDWRMTFSSRLSL